MPSASKTLASSLLALRVCSWPAVAAGRAADAPAPVQEVEFQVPKGFAMSARRASRPGGGVAAFLVPQLWCAAASDDSIEIEGSFSSVRGKPRSGRARLRADGTLED